MSENNDFKPISAAEIKANGVQALADRPNKPAQYGIGGLTPAQLKAWFDRLATLLAGRINAIITTLGSTDAPKYIRVPLDAANIKYLSDFISAFESGDIAADVLEVRTSAADEKKIPLQAKLNSMDTDKGKLEESYENGTFVRDTLKILYKNSPASLAGVIDAIIEAVGALEKAELDDGEVTTAKIADGTVTADKLAQVLKNEIKKIDGKVDKDDGKGLSTNDYTDAAKAKVDAIPANPKYTDTVYDDTDIKNRTAEIEGKIPMQASSGNQLADKDFVNSSIATQTAAYISDNGQPFASFAALKAYTGVVTNLDYAYVTGKDSDGNTYYDRYKATVTGGSVSWSKEFRLNNSSFTAAQWSAISSGITAALVLSYNRHIAAKNNPHGVTYEQLGGTKPAYTAAEVGALPANTPIVTVKKDSDGNVYRIDGSDIAATYDENGEKIADKYATKGELSTATTWYEGIDYPIGAKSNDLWLYTGSKSHPDGFRLGDVSQYNGTGWDVIANIRGAAGENGVAGKSAYASAQDGGFTGTEAQFNKGLSVMGQVDGVEDTDALGIDTTVTQNSGNLITSGAVYEYTNSAINHVRHYGARWNKTQAQMVRMYDAASFPTAITNFAHRGSVNANYSNPFDSIYPWAGIKLCNISIDLYRNLAAGDSVTKCVTAWEGDVDFSYEDANGVWRYRPEFWGKSWEDDTYRYFDVSEKAIGSYVHYPEAIVGRWHGRTATLTIGEAEKTCLVPSVGLPATRIAMSTLHTYAKNYGATVDSIFSVDPDTLLCIVEFATMNTQNAIGSGVSNLYRQSSDLIQEDATNSTVVKVLASAGNGYCIPGAIFDIGTSNGGNQVGTYKVISAATNIGDAQYLDVTLDRETTVTGANYWSVHGLANTADEDIGSKSGYIGTDGRCNAYYRGIVLYGNMFLYTLGAYENHTDHHIWIANSDEEADGYDALNTAVHHDTGIVLPTSGGYAKKLGMLSHSGLLSIPVFCTEIGGDSGNPIGDYFYNGVYTYNTVLIRGGSASDGSVDGAFFGGWYSTASLSYWGYAARPRLKNP